MNDYNPGFKKSVSEKTAEKTDRVAREILVEAEERRAELMREQRAQRLAKEAESG